LTGIHEQTWAAFSMTQLRPDQVAGSILQTASLSTLKQDSPLVTRIIRLTSERDFVQRYGDTGQDEFDMRNVTVAQVLLLMNGQLVKAKTQEGLFNAAWQIAALAPDDRTAVETAYLTVLTRRPTHEEAAYFEGRLADTQGAYPNEILEDLFWILLNSQEFSCNH
jgi:hypothetical protein